MDANIGNRHRVYRGVLDQSLVELATSSRREDDHTVDAACAGRCSRTAA
jgi:hypothetical protein|eukprot:SAG25_NODE_829_length_5170_cov_2.432656_5_plen_49_part_00